MENLPASSVFVPADLFLMVIETSGTGFPFSSVTVPLIFRFCANNSVGITDSNRNTAMIRIILQDFPIWRANRINNRFGLI
jgi:hypothetical protein